MNTNNRQVVSDEVVLNEPNLHEDEQEIDESDYNQEIDETNFEDIEPKEEIEHPTEVETETPETEV